MAERLLSRLFPQRTKPKRGETSTRVLIGLGAATLAAVALDTATHQIRITDSGDLLAVGAGCVLTNDIAFCYTRTERTGSHTVTG